jgi:FkbM family methyltransferase
LKAGLARFGFHVERTRPLASECDYSLKPDFDYVLAHYLARRDGSQPFFFVQVGAFDGVSHDRLYEHVRKLGWQGVLIEPQPRHFAALVENYKGAGEGLIFLNAAVDRERGTRALYVVVQGESGEPIDSLGGLASFSRQRLLDWQRQDGHRFPGCSVGSLSVTCVTFDDVLADAAYVDLVHIDAEGYDLVLLKLFDFARFAPTILRFEHAHLSRADWDEAVRHLARHGYRVLQEEYDTTAYLVEGRV